MTHSNVRHPRIHHTRCVARRRWFPPCATTLYQALPSLPGAADAAGTYLTPNSDTGRGCQYLKGAADPGYSSPSFKLGRSGPAQKKRMDAVDTDSGCCPTTSQVDRSETGPRRTRQGTRNSSNTHRADETRATGSQGSKPTTHTNIKHAEPTELPNRPSMTVPVTGNNNANTGPTSQKRMLRRTVLTTGSSTVNRGPRKRRQRQLCKLIWNCCRRWSWTAQRPCLHTPGWTNCNVKDREDAQTVQAEHRTRGP